MSFSSVTKSIELEKQEEYISMGIPWYFIYNASNFPLYDIKFLEMCFEKIEEQYSICDLIRAVYINFSSCLGRCEVIPRSPGHLLATLSICGPNVRC